MTRMLLWGLLILFMVYAIIPRIITRFFWLRIFPKMRAGNKVALTFDDGPHPKYTPQLLDLLQKHEVKATFFVLGSQAAKYPDLIRRIHKEGHLIGIHNYYHQANWLLPPWQVRRQVFRSAEIVREITGSAPVFYRPPWGLLTLFDLFLQSRFRIVLWSVMVGDWNCRTDKETIKDKLLHRIKGGSVVVLHDSGETFGADQEAPDRMLRALEEVLQQIRLNRYDCVRLDEWMKKTEGLSVGWGKRLLVAGWMQWEKMFQLFFRVHPVDRDNQFLSVRVRTYQGKTIRLNDGEEIRKGDRIVELHLNNEMLFAMGANTRSAIQLALQMIRAVEQLLPKIVHLIIHNPHFQRVKGVYGVTIIHRGPEQFGFTVLDLPKGIASFVTRIYLRLLLTVIHPLGSKRLQIRSNLLIPKMIAISSKELMRRYQVENLSDRQVQNSV